MTDAVVNELKKPEDFSLELTDTEVKVKGKEESIDIYTIDWV